MEQSRANAVFWRMVADFEVSADTHLLADAVNDDYLNEAMTVEQRHGFEGAERRRHTMYLLGYLYETYGLDGFHADAVLNYHYVRQDRGAAHGEA